MSMLVVRRKAWASSNLMVWTSLRCHRFLPEYRAAWNLHRASRSLGDPVKA